MGAHNFQHPALGGVTARQTDEGLRVRVELASGWIEVCAPSEADAEALLTDGLSGLTKARGRLPARVADRKASALINLLRQP